MKFRSCLLLSSLLLPLPATAEPWLRVEQPSESLRAQLPARAIDYDSFIWMPAAAAPTGVLGARVQRSEQPFALVIDGEPVDPLQMPASNNPWWQANSISGGDFRLVQLYGPPRVHWIWPNSAYAFHGNHFAFFKKVIGSILKVIFTAAVIETYFHHFATALRVAERQVSQPVVHVHAVATAAGTTAMAFASTRCTRSATSKSHILKIDN